MRALAGSIVLLLASGPTAATGQQMVERFAVEARHGTHQHAPDRAAFEGRSSYWLEGAGIGLAAGVITALIVVDPAQECPLEPGAPCNENPATVVIGSVLMGTVGAVLGGMLGASIPRAGDQ